jgi:MFS family permease
VSWGLTLTLMLRSVGALIFGTMADRYGRKCKKAFVNFQRFGIDRLISDAADGRACDH